MADGRKSRRSTERFRLQPLPGNVGLKLEAAMSVYIRIALRYIAGYLALVGLLPEDIADMIANDPELAAVIGMALATGVEAIYRLAKRLGWRT